MVQLKLDTTYQEEQCHDRQSSRSLLPRSRCSEQRPRNRNPRARWSKCSKRRRADAVRNGSSTCARAASTCARPISNDLSEIKKSRGVPDQVQSCHTAVVNGYVVEGHVPAADVHRMLKEKPAIAGIAVGGMPVGSPGMEFPVRRRSLRRHVVRQERHDTRVRETLICSISLILFAGVFGGAIASVAGFGIGSLLTPAIAVDGGHEACRCRRLHSTRHRHVDSLLAISSRDRLDGRHAASASRAPQAA